MKPLELQGQTAGPAWKQGPAVSLLEKGVGFKPGSWEGTLWGDSLLLFSSHGLLSESDPLL